MQSAASVQRCLFQLGAGVMLSVFATGSVAKAQSLHILEQPKPPRAVLLQRADPHVSRDAVTGCYYLAATEPSFQRLELRKSCQWLHWQQAQTSVIWQGKAGHPIGMNLWAPELHKVGHQWVILFAAAPQGAPFHIRMHRLVNDAADPMQPTWRYAGQIHTPTDGFALDASTFVVGEQRYLIWAEQDAARSVNSVLNLAKIDAQFQLQSAVTTISKPELAWEIQGYKVNEGPAVLIDDSQIFISYSASATDARYAMGLLQAPLTADLLQASVWHKQQSPWFATAPNTQRFGPGHNSFVQDPDGHWWMFYHARDYQALQGTPLTDPNRHTYAARLQLSEAAPTP